MSQKRVISMENNTKIYHKNGCRYTHRILSQNFYQTTRKDARRYGFRCCRYCNSMNHHFKTEEHVLDNYAEQYGFTYKYDNGMLYVKTEIGFWKLVYSRKEEKIAIYHRNDAAEPVNMDNPEQEQFHRQKDIDYSTSIAGCLNYIYQHDKFKAAVLRGDKDIRYSSKKYEKTAAKREVRSSIRRVNYLFSVLEKENKDYKKLSYC